MEKAQEQIAAIAQDLMQNMCFVEMQVDNKLFKHIIGKSGANVNKLKDDFNVVINIDESGLIRIEGSREDVSRTKEELEQRIFKLENEKERDVIIEQRHYRNIIGMSFSGLLWMIVWLINDLLQALKENQSRKSETSSIKSR